MAEAGHREQGIDNLRRLSYGIGINTIHGGAGG